MSVNTAAQIPPLESARSEHAGGGRDTAGGRMVPRVLVIDDEPLNIKVLTGMLERAGFEAFSAANGVIGRELAQEIRPDIILLDIMMPGEDGFSTLAKLQQLTETMDVPVIFISALSDVNSKVQALDSGAVDYVTKPFERGEVLARIRLHLRLVQARKLLVESQARRLKELADSQQSILPSPESLPEAAFGVVYTPADIAGGDFYDVVASGSNSHSYFVADICGHDLGAYYITSSLKALLTQNSGPLYTPLETMRTINGVLRSILSEGKFLTAQLLHLDRARGTATLYSAGHPYPVYVPVNGTPRFVEARGDILGVFPGVFLEPCEWKVEPGDMIYMYTDGLVERFNRDGSFNSRLEDMLLEACAQASGLGPMDAVTDVTDRLASAEQLLQDDMVLLGIEV